MELLTVANILKTWYRLVGTEEGDQELTLRGESQNDVAYQYLTRGFRAAQLFLIDNGFQSWWRSRSAALTWSGTEAANGGRYTTLPSNFLRLWGNRENLKSAIVEADGTEWGEEIEEDQSAWQGQFYYLKYSQLWITREADPPGTAYLEFYHQHPAFKTGSTVLADASLDFPTNQRILGVRYAAVEASGENWFPGDEAERRRLRAGLQEGQQDARKQARRSRRSRQMQPARRAANHY